MSGQQRIETMFAFVATDPADGIEGIVGIRDPLTHEWIALVGADMARVESLRPIAQSIADDTGQPIRVLKFTTREELSTIVPR